MAHTSRCEKADGPECDCSCGGLLHGGTGHGRWWRPVGNVVASGMAPIPSPRGADVVQAGIETLHLVHDRDRRALRQIHSALTTTIREQPGDSHWLCTLLIEQAELDADADADADADELWSALAHLSFAATFSPSPATVIRVAALLCCPDPARHPDLERSCILPLSRQLTAEVVALP